MEHHGRIIELLHVSIDPDPSEDSEFRFVVDNQSVKYVTISGGLFEPLDMSFEPALVPQLPPFPPVTGTQPAYLPMRPRGSPASRPQRRGSSQASPTSGTMYESTTRSFAWAVDSSRTSTKPHVPVSVPRPSSSLEKLHALGIRHGATNKHNFLVHHDRVTMIDFDVASRPASAKELEQEMQRLLDQLRDTSGRGGVYSVA